MPACAVILSGWLDLTLRNAAKKSKDDVLITMKHLTEVRDSYLQGTVSPYHYMASPIYGNIKGLPPLFMHASDSEILLNDTVSFVKKAGSENIKVQFERGKNMLHVHPLLFPSDSCSLEVIDKITTFISQNISTLGRPR
jgi:acetyl esterase/lipase